MESERKHIVWHPSRVSRSDRSNRFGHRSCVLWFTGLSGSGKSTLAYEVEKVLFDRGCCAFVLDGDNIRHGLNNDLGFRPEHRKENIRRVAETAKLFVEAGTIVMTSFISPYRDDRDTARSLYKDGEFIEIYVKCPLDECERRDPKGLYRKVRAGQITEFTGISAPYEPPDKPEMIVESDRLSIGEAVEWIVRYLQDQGYIR